MVFKSLHELAPKYLCGLFIRNSKCSSYVLRNSETDLRLPLKKSSNGQKCSSYRGAKAWNDLLADTKQATSLNSFKNLFRTFSYFFYTRFCKFRIRFFILWLLYCNFGFLFGNCILYIVSSFFLINSVEGQPSLINSNIKYQNISHKLSLHGYFYQSLTG